MRRKDREITGIEEIKNILRKGRVCRLALAVDDMPYIVPMNYGVEFSDPMVLYFHCATKGRKLEMLKQNNRVCFEIESDTSIIRGIDACDWTMHYKSIVGYGTIEVITGGKEMLHGMDLLMEHYAGKGNFSYSQQQLERMYMLKLTVETISGKSHGV